MSSAPPWSLTTTSAHKISPPKENRKNLRRAFAGPKLASGATAMRARQHTHDVADRARYVSSSIRKVFAVRIDAVLLCDVHGDMRYLVNSSVHKLRPVLVLPTATTLRRREGLLKQKPSSRRSAKTFVCTCSIIESGAPAQIKASSMSSAFRASKEKKNKIVQCLMCSLRIVIIFLIFVERIGRE